MESANNKAKPGQRKSKKSKWKKTTVEFGTSSSSNQSVTQEEIKIAEKINNDPNDSLPLDNTENKANKYQLPEKIKNEFDRCLAIAKKYLDNNEFDRALIFANKVLQLCPSPESFSLLNEIQQKKEEIIKKLLEDETEKLKKQKIIETNENLCKQIINPSTTNQALGINENTSDKDAIRIIKKFLRILHPDKNLAPSSQDATQTLISIKERLEEKQKIPEIAIDEEQKEEEVLVKGYENPEHDISDNNSNSDEDIDVEPKSNQRIPKSARFRGPCIIKDEPQISGKWPYEEDINVYEELEDYILQFSNNEFSRNPTSEEIPNEFISASDYIAKLKAAYFVELHEIILKAINGVFTGKKYFVSFDMNDDYFTLSSRCRRFTIEEFSLEIQANDLLFICDIEYYGFIENHYDLKQSPFNLGIVKKNPNDNIVKILSLIDDDPDIQYCVISIGNLTTLRREFLTFTKIKEALLLDHILNPRYPISLGNPIVSQRFLNTIKKKFNQGQYEALLNALSIKEGIMLIQGPPGTGKTSTIMGLISGYWSAHSGTKPKILVCAPSNAAIDEIASRANQKMIFDEDGNPVAGISLLRIGQKRFKNELGIIENISVKDIPTNVKKISLNYLCEKDLNGSGFYDQAKTIKEKVQEEHKLGEKLEEMLKKGNADIKKFEELVKKREELLEDIEYLKEEQIEYLENRKKSRKDLIQAADVIFCTTSTAGSADMLSAFQNSKDRISPRRFDYLIIDEACQCVELNMLIPFLYDTPTAVLLGDHKQLPATTFSEHSKINKYNRSIFERFIDCQISPQILKVQYRMIKELCQYPSIYFYDHLLKSHPSVDSRQAPPGIRPLGLLFINLTKSQEIRDEYDYSYYNEIEAKYIVKKIIGENVKNVGIIAPYRKQVEYLKQLLDEKFQGDWRDRIEVDSVDGYQGREKDFIILSLVRSDLITGNIGFLKDIRRMNVAITRAKFALHIVGNAISLKKNDDWDNFIDYCDSKNKLIHSDYNGKQSYWNQLELENKVSLDRNWKQIEFNIRDKTQD